MKKFITIAFFIVFTGVFIVSCKEDDPVTKLLMTVDVAAGTFSATDSWYIAWDNDGALLDFKKYTPGELLTLATGNISITSFTLGYVSYDNTTGRMTYRGRIYTDVPTGSTFKRSVTEHNPSFSGNFNLNFAEELFSPPVVSTKHGLTSHYDVSSPYRSMLDNAASKYLVTLHNESGTRYRILTDVKNNDEFDLQIADFSPYENTVTINLPDADYAFGNFLFTGFEEGQSLSEFGYRLDSYVMPHDMPSLVTGYFPSLTKFSFSLSLVYDETNVSYLKKGGLPGQITWPDVKKYSIVSSDPNSFKLAATANHVYVESSWDNSDLDNYYVLSITSPQLEPKIGQVPAEILAAHPQLEIKKENYSSAFISFVASGSQTYQQMLSEYLSGGVEEKENLKVTIIED